jgi:hypothetical protein
VLAVTDDMRAFLDAHVHPRAADQVRLRELIEAIITTDVFSLEFNDRTRTASEAFRLRTGNCLSFSNMFVAMAREVGLMFFQEVDSAAGRSIGRLSQPAFNVRADLARCVHVGIQHRRLQGELQHAHDLRHPGAGPLLQQHGRREHAGR